MSKKDERFLVGDTVWHRAGGDEPVRGIVVKVGYVLVDWGPENGQDCHDPNALSDTPVKRFNE